VRWCSVPASRIFLEPSIFFLWFPYLNIKFIFKVHNKLIHEKLSGRFLYLSMSISRKLWKDLSSTWYRLSKHQHINWSKWAYSRDSNLLDLLDLSSDLLDLILLDFDCLLWIK
jgi:hypothetical protein